jgi:hypothetical protein
MAKSDGPPRGKTKNEGKKMRTASQGPSGRVQAPIDPRIQVEIGKHLRAVYDDVINEPVPDKFMELLQKLEQSATRKT